MFKKNITFALDGEGEQQERRSTNLFSLQWVEWLLCITGRECPLTMGIQGREHSFGSDFIWPQFV